MQLKFINRQKVLRDFNERNHTTHYASKYVAVTVDGDRLVFSHINSVGIATFTPDDRGNHLRGLSVDGSYRD